MAFGDPFYNRGALPREAQPSKSAIEQVEDMKSRSEPKPEAGPKEKPKEILSPESIRKQVRHEMINGIYNELRRRGKSQTWEDPDLAEKCHMLHDIAMAFKDKGYHVKESYGDYSISFSVKIQMEPFDTPPFTLPEAPRGAE